VVQQPLQRLPIHEVGLHHLWRILYLDSGVEDAIRLGNNDRALLTETMTTGSFDLDSLRQTRALEFLHKRLVNLGRFRGLASGSLAD
jgi:predicted nucleotidyltransferase component of viral defense system